MTPVRPEAPVTANSPSDDISVELSKRRTGRSSAESHFPPSMTLIIAVILLAIGIVAIMSMAFHVGPFG